MNLGISSYTYGWNIGVKDQIPTMPFDEHVLIQKTTGFGLNVLQIGDNYPIHLLEKERLLAFKSALTHHNIVLELGAKNLTEEHLGLYINLCELLGVRLLRFVIDSDTYEPKPVEVIAILKNFIADLKNKNITLGIENHDRFKVKELANIIASVGDNNVGICLDCVNSIGSGEGLEYVAEVLAPYTVNLHIKDYTIKRLSHKMGFIVEGQIAGQGMTNVPWLVKKIESFGRCKTAILEQWVPPELTVAASCTKEVQWALDGVTYLKTIL